MILVYVSHISDPKVKVPPLNEHIIRTVLTPKVCYLSRKQSIKSVLSVSAVKKQCSEQSSFSSAPRLWQNGKEKL